MQYLTWLPINRIVQQRWREKYQNLYLAFDRQHEVCTVYVHPEGFSQGLYRLVYDPVPS